MKALITILVIGILSFGYIYLNSNQNQTTNQTPEIPQISGEDIAQDFSGTYVFNADQSEVKWTGSKKIVLNYVDNGTINLLNGFVDFSNGEIIGGEIIFDMNSISTNSTGSGSGNERLTEHLKSADFFEVETFPQARYLVTGAERNNQDYILKGELTLKDQTNPIEIPVRVTTESGNVTIAGLAEIDRTVWNVRFGSDKFFDNLGDNVISDIFTLEFKIVATP